MAGITLGLLWEFGLHVNRLTCRDSKKLHCSRGHGALDSMNSMKCCYLEENTPSVQG